MGWRLWWIFLIIAIFLLVYPVGLRCIRTYLILAVFALPPGFVFLFCKPWCKALLISALIFMPLLLFLMLPGRPADPLRLREAYLKSLASYEGVRYIWGGENLFGIDCSGLVRQGLINANLKEGLRSLNPALLREAFLLFWNDRTARALGEGADGLLFKTGEAKSINELDHSTLCPGDIAVSQNGAHVMAYLGESTWIEADPGPGKVIKVTIPEEKNPWFCTPVRLFRWRSCAATDPRVES